MSKLWVIWVRQLVRHEHANGWQQARSGLDGGGNARTWRGHQVLGTCQEAALAGSWVLRPWSWPDCPLRSLSRLRLRTYTHMSQYTWLVGSIGLTQNPAIKKLPRSALTTQTPEENRKDACVWVHCDMHATGAGCRLCRRSSRCGCRHYECMPYGHFASGCRRVMIYEQAENKAGPHRQLNLYLLHFLYNNFSTLQRPFTQNLPLHSPWKIITVKATLINPKP